MRIPLELSLSLTRFFALIRAEGIDWVGPEEAVSIEVEIDWVGLEEAVSTELDWIGPEEAVSIELDWVGPEEAVSIELDWVGPDGVGLGDEGTLSSESGKITE